jgi:hypothetical protein
MSDQDDTYGGIFWVRAEGGGLVSATPGEACDEIKRLRAENARLREALVPLKLIADRYDDDGLDEARPSWGGCVPDEILMVQGRGGKAFLTLQQCFDARAALEVKP